MKPVPSPSRVLATIVALVVLIAGPAPLSHADTLTYTPADFSCDNVTEIPKSECEALVSFYNNTNGPEWRITHSWLQTNTPCGWYGVSCGQGHIQSLSLSYNNLSGTIPFTLGQLPHLQYLHLYYNQLSGPIPPELGQLPQLQSLYLYNNQLSGSIPSELGQLPQLQYLDVYNPVHFRQV